MILLAEAAPVAGRLAFAAVFLALTVWLIFMPKRLLDEGGSVEKKPVWRQIRTWALVIAVSQLLIYLFWT